MSGSIPKMISHYPPLGYSSQHAGSFEPYDVGLPPALLPQVGDVVSITNINSSMYQARLCPVYMSMTQTAARSAAHKVTFDVVRDPNCAHIFGPAVAFPT